MLRIGSGSFDPETLVILETAFDEAWITLKTNGSGNIRPDELARRICHLAMEGERDPVRLHDRALGELVPAATKAGADRAGGFLKLLSLPRGTVLFSVNTADRPKAGDCRANDRVTGAHRALHVGSFRRS